MAAPLPDAPAPPSLLPVRAAPRSRAPVSGRRRSHGPEPAGALRGAGAQRAAVPPLSARGLCVTVLTLDVGPSLLGGEGPAGDHFET